MTLYRCESMPKNTTSNSQVDRLLNSMNHQKMKQKSTFSVRTILSSTLIVFIAIVTHWFSQLNYRFPTAFIKTEFLSLSPFDALWSSWLQSGLWRRLSGPAPTDDGAVVEEHFMLFGGISSLDIMIGSVSIIIIVAAVQFIEYLFHSLHLITHDTPFNQMVQSIEKELMVVGFTAFIFKIVVSSTSFLSPDWFHALEYADILVPIFSFSYCGLGLMLILMSISISNIWSEAYHHRLIEMLDGYYDLSGMTGYLPYGLWLAPLHPAISKIEFRIFHNIFCDTYKIQKAAFAFNEYVEKVFEKYVLTLVEIRPVDWLMLCVLVLLNWGRYALGWEYKHCGRHALDPQTQHECELQDADVIFTVAGAIIFVLTLVMAVESRRLEVRIMAQKNLLSVHAYPSYLKYMEESAEATQQESYRLNVNELKTSAEEVKYSMLKKEGMQLLSISILDKQRHSEQMLRKLKEQFPTLLPEAPATPQSGSAAAQSTKSSGGKRSSVSHKFGASVKQTWVSKKKVNKRNRHKSFVAEVAESSVRVGRSIRSIRSSFVFGDTDSDKARSNAIKNAISIGGGGGSSKNNGPPRGSSFRRYRVSSSKIAVTNDVIQEQEENENDNDNENEAKADDEPARLLRDNTDRNARSSLNLDKEAAFNAQPGPKSVSGGVSHSHLSADDSSGTGIDKNTFSGRADPSSLRYKQQPGEDELSGGDVEQGQGQGQGLTNHVRSFGMLGGEEESPSGSRVDLMQSRAESGGSGFMNFSTRECSSKQEKAKPKPMPKTTAAHSMIDGLDKGAGLWEDEEHVIADVFFLSWPELYLEGVQSLIMIIALYYALYFTNFIAAAESSSWKGLTLIPAVASSLLLVYIVKCAVMLSALHAVDCDAILDVLEQTEGARLLSEQIKVKIIGRLQEMGTEPQSEIFNLFGQIDHDGSGFISREKFSVFMQTIEIHSDRRRWLQVFRGIDTDFNQKIAFEEFFLFLFPEHSIGLALQKKKERVLEVRVQGKAEKRKAVLKKYGSSNVEFVPPAVEGSGKGPSLRQYEGTLRNSAH